MCLERSSLHHLHSGHLLLCRDVSWLMTHVGCTAPAQYDPKAAPQASRWAVWVQGTLCVMARVSFPRREHALLRQLLEDVSLTKRSISEVPCGGDSSPMMSPLMSSMLVASCSSSSRSEFTFTPNLSLMTNLKVHSSAFYLLCSPVTHQPGDSTIPTDGFDGPFNIGGCGPDIPWEDRAATALPCSLTLKYSSVQWMWKCVGMLKGVCT